MSKIYMKLKDGKSKVLTLSYDDGVVQDIRLMGILDKHGIKATFNINSGLFEKEDTVRERYYGRMKLSEAKQLYVNSGHEVAVHMYSHPYPHLLSKADVADEVLRDRENLEREFGGVVTGMAYPYGTYNDEVIEVLKMCGIDYSRTVVSTENFNFPPENWLTLHATCHHRNPRLMELAKNFTEEKPRPQINRMFYLWGHSYEFDNNDNWNIIEEFAEYIGGREDIWYATNIEIYKYCKAFAALEKNVDNSYIHNPTETDIWISKDDKTIKIAAGETFIDR